MAQWYCAALETGKSQDFTVLTDEHIRVMLFPQGYPSSILGLGVIKFSYLAEYTNPAYVVIKFL